LIGTDTAGIGSGAGPDRGFAEGTVMLDFAMLAAGIGFFAIAVLYVLACERM
jgi:hypothetical protein